MRLDKFTIKAQEAVQASQDIADRQGHQMIEPEHLLLALLSQREGVVRPLLKKLEVNPDALANGLEDDLAKLPKVAGVAGNLYMGLGSRSRWTWLGRKRSG